VIAANSGATQAAIIHGLATSRLVIVPSRLQSPLEQRQNLTLANPYPIQHTTGMLDQIAASWSQR
jgi:hypothetical protein